MSVKVREGRKNTERHYFEIRLQIPRLNVIAQKSGARWFLYLSWPGVKGPVRVLPTGFLAPELARNAVVSIAEGLEAYFGIDGW
jgi:hypothetical protein